MILFVLILAYEGMKYWTMCNDFNFTVHPSSQLSMLCVFLIFFKSTHLASGNTNCNFCLFFSIHYFFAMILKLSHMLNFSAFDFFFPCCRVVCDILFFIRWLLLEFDVIFHKELRSIYWKVYFEVMNYIMKHCINWLEDRFNLSCI